MKRALFEKNDMGKSFGLAVGVMLAAQLILSVAFLPTMDIVTQEMPDWATWLMQALYTLAIGASPFIYAHLFKVDWVSATTIKVKPAVDHIGWGCLSVLFLIAFMIPLNEFFMRLLVNLGFTKPDVPLPLQLVPMLFIACVLPSFTEELLFRGTIAQCLSHDDNKLAAIAISGALFSVFHMNPAQTVHQFVLGCFLTLLFFRSGSVWTTVVVHFFNNIMAVVLSFTVGDDSTLFVDYWYVFIPVGVLGFAACIFGYIKTTKSVWGKQELAQQEQIFEAFDDVAVSENQAFEEGQVHTKDPMSVTMLAVSVGVCLLLWVVTLVAK